MGSSWSSPASLSSLPSSSSSQAITTGDERNENGKRIRSTSSSSSSDGERSLEGPYRAVMMPPPRRPKRQRIEDYTPNHPPSLILGSSASSASHPRLFSYGTSFAASTLRSISDRFCVVMAQGFLSLAESSTRHATYFSNNQGYAFPDEELFQSVSDMLDDFQSLEPDILTRGWRVLCACSLVKNSTENENTNGIVEANNNYKNANALAALPDNDVGTVIMGMKLHHSSMRLQLLGCRALKILLDTERATWAQLADEKFVTVMLTAMKQFRNDLVLQGLMMSFLGMMIREIDQESLQRELLEIGVVEVILGALEKFEDHTRFVHTGCLALLQISASLQEARERIVQNNGHVLVYRIMKQHIRDELLLIVSLNTLSRLLSVQTFDGLPMEEVAQTILQCMELYPRDEAVQSHSLVSLLRLGEHTRVPADAAIQKIVPTMTFFRQSRSLVFIACVVIRSIIANSNQPAMVLQHLLDVGGVECIVNASKDHQSNTGIQQIVQLLLSVLLVHQQTAGVPLAFRGSLRVVGMMSRIDFESDEDDDEWQD